MSAAILEDVLRSAMNDGKVYADEVQQLVDAMLVERNGDIHPSSIELFRDNAVVFDSYDTAYEFTETLHRTSLTKKLQNALAFLNANQLKKVVGRMRRLYTIDPHACPGLAAITHGKAATFGCNLNEEWVLETAPPFLSRSLATTFGRSEGMYDPTGGVRFNYDSQNRVTGIQIAHSEKGDNLSRFLYATPFTPDDQLYLMLGLPVTVGIQELKALIDKVAKGKGCLDDGFNIPETDILDYLLPPKASADDKCANVPTTDDKRKREVLLSLARLFLNCLSTRDIVDIKNRIHFLYEVDASRCPGILVVYQGYYIGSLMCFTNVNMFLDIGSGEFPRSFRDALEHVMGDFEMSRDGIYQNYTSADPMTPPWGLTADELYEIITDILREREKQ